MRNLHHRLFAAGMIGAALSACDVPLAPTAQTSGMSTGAGAQMSGGVPEPLCQAGCIETDPNPNAPGYFLGSAVRPIPCLDDMYTDADLDGLGDFCERNLALKFAPEFRTWSLDNTGGEPHWAGSPGPNGTVRIVYLPAYYRDEGSPSYLCNLPPPFWHWSCEGHNGDSEAVMLELKYLEATEHWVLERAWLSQHGDVREYSGTGTTTTPNGKVKLQYPDRPQGYLRIWASQGKHANYASQGECDSGGSYSTDTCDQADTSWRLFVSATYDLGTRAHPLIDCVPSRNPAYQYYGDGRVECFWTPPPTWWMTEKFAGWIPDSIGGARSEHYSAVLEKFGF